MYTYLLGGGVPLLTCISYMFDACVPIYLFCSGYGLCINEISKPSNFKIRCNRILKLLIRVWTILGITCLVGYCMGMQEIYPGTVWNLFLNVLFIKNSYVGAFWFVQTYTLLVLSSQMIYNFIKKNSYIVTGIFSLSLYVISFVIDYFVLGKLVSNPIWYIVRAVMLFLKSQLSFVIGMIFANENIIDKNQLVSKIRENKIVVWFITVILICIRAKFAHAIFAPFSAILLIVLFGTYAWCAWAKRLLLFFGKHSTNMWLVHMQFYMIFTPRLVFGSRNVFVIMMTLIGLSVASSYMIEFLYRLVKRLIWKNMPTRKDKDLMLEEYK